MIVRLASGIVLLAASAGGAIAQPASNADSPPTYAASPPQAVSSRAFVNRAAVDDLFQVRSAQLARQRSSNDAVKAFAARLIQDHTDSTNGLLDAVHQAHLVSHPESIPTILDRPHQVKLQQLEAVSGADFDQRYMSMQIAADRESLSLLESYTATGDNPALKQYAKAVIPNVEEHLDMAQKIVNNGYKKVSDLD